MPAFTIEYANKVDIMWSRFKQMQDLINKIIIQQSSDILFFSSLASAAASNSSTLIVTKYFTVKEAINPAENGIFFFENPSSLTPDGINVANTPAISGGQLIRFI